MKTKAAILYENKKPLVIEEIELPKLREHETLIRIEYAGICGSQINEINGTKGKDKFLPHLLGHEASGKVIRIGNKITKVKVDDNVVVTWLKCNGRQNSNPPKYRNLNGGFVSTFQNYSVIPENRLIKNSFNIPNHIASLFGCMIPTGIGSINKFYDYDSASKVLITGVGNIGSSIILGMSMYDTKEITAIDINKSKLQYAKALGAKYINSAIERKGYDYAFETTGNISVTEKAFEALNDKGKLIIIGNSEYKKKIKIDPFEFIRGKQIFGSWGGNCSEKDIIKYMAMFKTNLLNLNKIPIKTYSLNNINEAIKDFRSGYCGKILIKMEHN